MLAISARHRSRGVGDSGGLAKDLVLVVPNDPLGLTNVLLLFIVHLDGPFECNEGNSTLHKHHTNLSTDLSMKQWIFIKINTDHRGSRTNRQLVAEESIYLHVI